MDDCLKKPKYLIKFVEKEEYADYLLGGNLFMHCAKYYHDMECNSGKLGRGDCREGLVFPDFPVYSNWFLPVYCLYTVFEQDIHNEKIIIEQRVIDDFNCATGFMVVIQFAGFEKGIQSKKSEYQVDYGNIRYKKPSREQSIKMFSEENTENLFFKHPYFEYQKEFRVVVCHRLYADNPPCDSERTYNLALQNPFDHQAVKIRINALHRSERGYELELSKLFV